MGHKEHVGSRNPSKSVVNSAKSNVDIVRRRLSVRVIPLAITLFLLTLWEWSVHGGRVSALIFPAPTTIAATLWQQLANGSLIQDTTVTLHRMILGFLIGGSAGIAMGMLMGRSLKIRTIVEPFLSGLHPVPKSALLPLLLVIMGFGDRPRLTLIALAAFFPLMINTLSSVRNIGPETLDAAANYGAQGYRLFSRVILPACLPGIFSGARLAANTAMTIAITTELLTSRTGLGARIWMAWETMRTENLYATLVVIVGIGLAINWLIIRCAQWLTPWSPDITSSE